MDEKNSTISGNSKRKKTTAAKRPDPVLTQRNIDSEIAKLTLMFVETKKNEPHKMKMIARIIEEVAFQKIAMKQAKSDMIIHGIQTTTKNAAQKFVKENPAVSTYDKYVRSYTANMKILIDMLPPDKKKTESKLEMLRDI